MWMPGPSEIIVIILVVILLFGSAKVPELARSLGKAIGEFKKAQREAELDYKKFEESVSAIGSKEEVPKAEAKGEDVKIKEVAEYLGIDTEGKTEEELKEEIRAMLESSKSKKG